MWDTLSYMFYRVSFLQSFTKFTGKQTSKKQLHLKRVICTVVLLGDSLWLVSFPAFGLNTERYGISLRIQSKGGKMRTRIISNTDTFHPVNMFLHLKIFKDSWKMHPCNYQICYVLNKKFANFAKKPERKRTVSRDMFQIQSKI